MNIHDYYPEIILIKGDHQTDYVVVAIVLILLLIVWIILMYYVGYHFRVIGPSKKIYLQCQPGQCSTIVATGEKHCPENPGDSVMYDGAYQTCNSRYGCENSRTPYAVQTDGSTNIMGVCESGVTCRCVNALVAFNMVNGTLYQDDPSSSRSSFQQIPLITDVGTTGTYSNPSTQFCAIKANHLNRVSPSACTYNDPNDISLAELKNCLNQVNPCILGQAAFYPQDFESFSLNNLNKAVIYNIPVTCVAVTNAVNGHSTGYCNVNSVPVFNKMIGKIECVEIGSD